MTALVLDGIFLENGLTNSYDGKNSFDLIIEKALEFGYERVIFLQNGSVDNVFDKIKDVHVDFTGYKDLLKLLKKEIRNCDTIVYHYADNPFYSNSIIDKMLSRHLEYCADFTYFLGFIEKLTPFIFSSSILDQLIELSDGVDHIASDFIFQIIAKDINSFDIETFTSDIDMRIMRAGLGESSVPDAILTDNLYNKISKVFFEKGDYNIVNDFIIENQNILFTLPYFSTIELVRNEKSSLIYKPDTDDKEVFLPLKFVISQIKSLLKINNQMKFIFSGIADPFDYPDIFKLISFFYDIKKHFIIETSLQLNEEMLKKLLDYGNDYLTIVVYYDSFSEDIYNQIHKNHDYSLMNSNYERLNSSGFDIYKSFVRMQDNEEDLEANYNKHKDEKIIIRKFSTYCGKINDRKVVDLSPLDRFGCYYLRRSVTIDAHGNAVLCPMAFDSVICSIKENGLESTIELYKKMFNKNSDGDYLTVCNKCDDYYIFNF